MHFQHDMHYSISVFQADMKGDCFQANSKSSLLDSPVNMIRLSIDTDFAAKLEMFLFLLSL